MFVFPKTSFPWAGGGGERMVGVAGVEWGCFSTYTKSGRGGGDDRVSRSPGYSLVLEFMRTGMNSRAASAIIIKCGPKSYEFINGRGGGGGGGQVPRVPPPPPLPWIRRCIPVIKASAFIYGVDEFE